MTDKAALPPQDQMRAEFEAMARWHHEQASWHRHAAETSAADKAEPTRSMLIAAASMHDKFALLSREQAARASADAPIGRIDPKPELGETIRQAWLAHGSNWGLVAAAVCKALDAEFHEAYADGRQDQIESDAERDLRYEEAFEAGRQSARDSVKPQEPSAWPTRVHEAAERLLMECRVSDVSGGRDDQFRQDIEAVANAALASQPQTPAQPSIEPIAQVSEVDGKKCVTFYSYKALWETPLWTKLYAHSTPGGEAITDEQIREVFLANGFTIKDGLSDLKPYVYKAARAILALASHVDGEGRRDQGDGVKAS